MSAPERREPQSEPTRDSRPPSIAPLLVLPSSTIVPYPFPIPPFHSLQPPPTRPADYPSHSPCLPNPSTLYPPLAPFHYFDIRTPPPRFSYHHPFLHSSPHPSPPAPVNQHPFPSTCFHSARCGCTPSQFRGELADATLWKTPVEL